MIFMHSNPMEESQMDETSVEFKHVHRIMKWTHIPLLLVVVIALKSWLPPRILTVIGAAECLAGFFVCLFNHHVVFLVGNAIILLMFIAFRQNDEFREDKNGGDGDGFDDYWHSQKLHALSPSLGAVDAEEKRVVFRSLGNEILKCDYLTAAMEEEKKQIDKFRKSPRRETAVRRRLEADIENLNSDDFRRMVDAFIGKHWSNKKFKY